MISPLPVVVLTPVKNEIWILERFLSVTSHFADLIIIADQNSTDGSRELCTKYPKVALIENATDNYDEALRQQLLIDEARRRIPGPKILLALDADEIMAATGPHTPGWQTVLHANPGTILCFEKPDLYETPDRCVRYSKPWPIGYVDDGAPHTPRAIHSIRIPTPPTALRLHIFDVKILHYGLCRLDAQLSKLRLYSLVENLLGTAHVFNRRFGYTPKRRYAQPGQIEPSPQEWFAGWEQLGTDMRTIQTEKYTWQDFEALQLFAKHGTIRFWLDNVWQFDWEACRQAALTQNVQGLPDRPVRRPPLVVRLFGSLLDVFFASLQPSYRFLKSRLGY